VRANPFPLNRLSLPALLPSLSIAAFLAGCAGGNGSIEPRPGPVAGLLPAEAEARAETVRRDPAGYLHQVAEHCRALRQYTLTFTRHERRGLFRLMHGPERIRCWFRREPFSVRMKWLDESIKYDETVYVAGQEDNKIRFVTRWWSPPLKPPPAVNKVNVRTPVIFGEARRPVTDFGLEYMMARTLASLERAGDDVVLTYEGLLRLPDGGPTVHHLHLEYPASRHHTPIQELYIDVATDLPAGTVLKLPSGAIDTAYFYDDINTNVKLSDDDFRLAAERNVSESTAGAASATP